MRIFYAVQATGNGHISRAIEILPYLQAYGDVDIFLSGSNYSLKSSLPVAYRSKGISLQYAQEKGSVDLLKTLTSVSLRKIWNEAKFLPIEKQNKEFTFLTTGVFIDSMLYRLIATVEAFYLFQ